MSDRTREANRAQGPKTVLDPLRPAVVVRRRVYDATPVDKDAVAPRTFTMASKPPSFVEAEDEEGGPPSSINVARALASLRADELRRVEEIVAADEDTEDAEDTDDAEDDEQKEVAPPAPEASAAPSAPAVPTVVLGKTIALSDLARKMGVSSSELPAALVARGFYALTAKTVLPRETARVIAEMYGWRVEDAPPELEEPTPVKSGVRSRIATKPKVGAKGKTKAKTGKVTPAKATPAKRRLAR